LQFQSRSLGWADQARGDFAKILDEPNFAKAQLATADAFALRPLLVELRAIGVVALLR
jgi:hypothetical protein